MTHAPNHPAAASSAHPARGLRLNFLTADVSAAHVPCTEIAYQSREHLAELREKLAGTHEVFRHGNHIRLVELVPDVERLGEPVSLEIPGPGAQVAARLLQESLRRYVTQSWRYQLRKPYPAPPMFVSRERGRDLLEDAHQRFPGTSALHVYPEYRLDGRYLHATKDVGVVIGLKTRYEMDLTVADLLRLGMDVTGRFALSGDGVDAFPHQDPRYARGFAGRIDKVDGSYIVLAAPGGAAVTVDAAELWLEPRKDNFDEALALVAGSNARSVLDRLDNRLYATVGGPGRLATIRKIGKALSDSGPFVLARGVQARFRSVLGDDERHPLPRPRTLSEPTYTFDMIGDKSERFAEPGLVKHGPFDREHFTPKSPHLVVVTPSHYQGAVEQFVRGFRDGVPNSRFSDGFVRRFGLNRLDVSIVTFEGTDAAAYRKACQRALEQHQRPDMAIVVVSKQQQNLTGNASPYLVTKSAFMSASVPVQEFQIENLRGRDFTEILRNVSLACYAKLGGTPYLIHAPHRPMAHELVIGLGSVFRTTDRMAPIERSVGITTVFDTMGNYMVSNTAREADYDEYPTALHEALTEVIADVKSREGWQPQDTVRLVFHAFKPLPDREAAAVKRLVEGLTKEVRHVEFAFLHVSDAHDWMLLDPDNTGLERGRGRFQGAGIPRRGLAVPLGRHELLVTVHGPRDLKTATQGAPRPLLLKLHRESTFDDIHYLAEQLFRFTAMSWRRPFPSSQPVTILYSEMMAKLLGQLREVRNWNSDMVNTRLQTSRWFL